MNIKGGFIFPPSYFKRRRVITRRSRKSIRTVLNRNFTFADLSPRFENVDSSTGNIFCPFHENHSTPAAKMYWNEEEGLWIIHCFGECHRNFTAYDYVDLVLCKKYQKYKSPLDFLKKNMANDLLLMQLELYEKEHEDQLELEESAKTEYISRVAFENEDLESYIESLYLA